MNKGIKGFTLIELLVVIVIITMVLAFIIPNFGDARKQSRDAQRKADLESVRTALELYKANEDYYPNGSGCTGSSSNFSNCTALRNALEGDGYISDLPDDPGSPASRYRYYTRPGDCNASGCTSYVVGAMLETEDPGTCTYTSLSCQGSSGMCDYCIENP